MNHRLGNKMEMANEAFIIKAVQKRQGGAWTRIDGRAYLGLVRGTQSRGRVVRTQSHSPILARELGMMSMGLLSMLCFCLS